MKKKREIVGAIMAALLRSRLVHILSSIMITSVYGNTYCKVHVRRHNRWSIYILERAELQNCTSKTDGIGNVILPTNTEIFSGM